MNSDKYEKVIRGLACRLECGCMNEDHCNPECPYLEDPRACYGLDEDALALMKEQEPRVMTLEEYEAWIDTPFTERNPVFHEERTKRGTVTCWVNTVVCTLREYGKNDRCWTSRPSDAQREETAWDV